jgi:folylpolyglutamate synthase/dihydropteroate synthase
MEDKELEQLLGQLAKRRRRVLLASLHQERAITPERLLAHPEAAGMPWERAPDLVTALTGDAAAAPLLVTGSFYLAAAAYAALEVEPWRGEAR